MKPQRKRNVIPLPISRTCTSRDTGCYISKAHRCLSDSIENLNDALSILDREENQRKRDVEAQTDVESLRCLRENLERLRGIFMDPLITMGTDCGEVAKCRE